MPMLLSLEDSTAAPIGPPEKVRDFLGEAGSILNVPENVRVLGEVGSIFNSFDS